MKFVDSALCYYVLIIALTVQLIKIRLEQTPNHEVNDERNRSNTITKRLGIRTTNSFVMH